MNRIKILAVSVVASTAVATGLMAASGAGATTTAAEGEIFSIDSTHSSILFKVSHLGITPFYGRFNTVKGTFSLDDGGSIDVIIDVNSVDTNDAKRDKHLKSADFFNAAQFATATFKSTSIEGEGDELEVTGDLTIRGTTKEVTFTLTKTGEGDRGERFGYRAGWEAMIVVNRHDFGVSYMPGGLGDDVTLILAIEGQRQ